jgi:hydrogenase nickel incorporation protein HypA/HybF
MHELSIAMNILDFAAEESERRGGVRVLAVHLKLGPLSGVVKEALQSAFGLARENVSACDTELVIEETPLVVYCPSCQENLEAVSIQELACRVCGTPTGHIVSGRELEVVALEIQ